jgi:hypothetical protein
MTRKTLVWGRFRGWQRFPLSTASFRISCNNSTASTNRRGDKGSPYLTPLLHRNVLPGTPFSSMDNWAELRISFVQVTHLVGKFSFCRVMMVGCSIVSKAFSKSNLRMTISLLDCWRLFQSLI